jgi:hypothetical protein
MLKLKMGTPIATSESERILTRFICFDRIGSGRAVNGAGVSICG